MAARKLQQEMDRVFKRVAEGVVAFDAIYDKVQTSGSQSQKEKLEQDLKREIKKLQRLRDQIKTWMGSNEIKDKKALTEQRRLIETEMERFKACEKEMKTKAYSKEGLSNSGKVDPKEKEKLDTISFVSSMLEELDRQAEFLEAEQETLQAGMKKGKKDHSKLDRISEIENALERHKWHQEKMEVMLRMLENGALQPEKVNAIQEDIKYYVESNQDVDFAEDEEIYDELELEDELIDMDYDGLAATTGKEEDHVVGAPVQGSPAPAPGPAANNIPTAATTTSAVPTAPSLTSTTATTATTPTTTTTTNNNLHDDSDKKHKDSIAAAVSANDKKKPSPSVAHVPMNKPSMSISTGSSPTIHANKIPQGLSPLPPPPPTSVLPNKWAQPPTEKDDESIKPPPQKQPTAQITQPSSAASTPKQPHAQPVATGPVSPATTVRSATPLPELMSFALPPGLEDLASAFDDARKRLAVPPPISNISMLLNASFLNCPDSSVADQPRNYHPTSPFPTPPFYPQEPLTNLDDPRIVAKMDLDTLFYVFYYRQGTYQQFLAAKELKARSWRFHKRFMTWFQRHEEPKIISSEYELGTYRFFDYEGSWMQRRKQNFKFEYQYLEDEL